MVRVVKATRHDISSIELDGLRLRLRWNSDKTLSRGAANRAESSIKVS